MNDYADREADRNHPVKNTDRWPRELFLLSWLLDLARALTASLVISYLLNPLFTVLLVLYFAMNVAYSFRLKHVVIIDIMIIAAGFVRAIAGGLVIHVPFTPWFLLCTMLLSLFLAIGKRRHELHLRR